jgi:ABC-type glycerol-3-phosphate transport system substrate-binding protein
MQAGYAVDLIWPPRPEGGWRIVPRLPTIGRMRMLRTCLIVPALLLGLSGCGSPYDPPLPVDHTSAKYQTDIAKCQTTSAETVRRQNADTPWTWMKSPFTGPPEVRAAIRTCMAHDGYTVEKAEN